MHFSDKPANSRHFTPSPAHLRPQGGTERWKDDLDFQQYFFHLHKTKYFLTDVHTEENWERPESGIYFTIFETTQYLINTLYLL